MHMLVLSRIVCFAAVNEARHKPKIITVFKSGEICQLWVRWIADVCAVRMQPVERRLCVNKNAGGPVLLKEWNQLQLPQPIVACTSISEILNEIMSAKTNDPRSSWHVEPYRRSCNHAIQFRRFGDSLTEPHACARTSHHFVSFFTAVPKCF